MYKKLRHVELHVLEIEIFLSVFLHLEQIVKLEIKLEKSSVSA